MVGQQFVLSADRSIMSHYRHNLLFGFLSSFPAEKFKPLIYKKIFCPSVEFDRNTGKAFYAPIGIRRIESGLRKHFNENNIFLAHPEHIEKSVGNDTKIIGIEVMDPFGIGPVPTTFQNGNMNPLSSITFKELCQKVKELKKKNKFKVVIGGAGAWQLSYNKKFREEYGIDHLVVGEADDKISGIFNDILSNNAEELIFTNTDEIDKIPEIKEPTCNGLIEAMRGCGRGCDFCDPNTRRKRDFPIKRLKREALINLNHDINTVWLQSEEILLYGLDNSKMHPNKDAVIDLFKEMKSLPKVDYVGAFHLTFSSAMAEPECIKKMSELNNFSSNRWAGIQTGLETGSVQMIKKHMPSKVKPFSPDEWPTLVREGTQLLNDNYYFAVNSLVIGLPGETDDDVKDTMDLVRSLDKMATLIIPLFYTDFHNPKNSLAPKNMTKPQWELLYLCWKINAKVIAKWLGSASSHFNPLMRTAALIFAKIGMWYWLRVIHDSAKHELGIDLT